MRKAWIILLLGILFTACSRPPTPDFNTTVDAPTGTETLSGVVVSENAGAPVAGS